MNNNTTSIVSKVWNFCHTLRDDGVSYGEYLEQLTYLLFLKMADEYAKQPYNRKSNIPKAYNWESLSEKRGRNWRSITSSCGASWGKNPACWDKFSSRRRTAFKIRPSC